MLTPPKTRGDQLQATMPGSDMIPRSSVTPSATAHVAARGGRRANGSALAHSPRMNAADIAVATVTLVRSAHEQRLLRRSLELLAGAGMPVAIADASAAPDFAQFLQQLPGAIVERPQQHGLVAQVQASVAAAAQCGRTFILYTEPDKEMFFARQLAQFVADARDDVSVSIAARSISSFETFPPMQKYVESIVNRLCGETTGVHGDYSYGPFLMARELAADVVAAPSHLGWGWRPFVFVRAGRRGLPIAHVVGEFSCPPDQVDEDAQERAHRLRQLRDNIAGLLA
jgi:hypothetical protein